MYCCFSGLLKIRRKIASFLPKNHRRVVIRKASQIAMSPNFGVETSNKIIITHDCVKCKLPYVCAGFLLFNVFNGIILFLFSHAIREIILSYPIFFGIYGLTMVSAAFGIFDRRDFLLYPFLIMTLPFIFVAALIFAFHLTNSYHCAFLKKNQSISTPMNYSVITPSHDLIYYDCSFIPAQETGWQAMKVSAFVAVAFLILALEKILEFYCFRKLQKHYYRLKCPQHCAVHTQTLRINEIIKHAENNDSDDEDMIIYERNNRSFRIPEYPAENPPFGTNRGGLRRTLA